MQLSTKVIIYWLLGYILFFYVLCWRNYYGPWWGFSRVLAEERWLWYLIILIRHCWYLFVFPSWLGNSGGPLVDVESGEVVGINTCIRANMEGTSFAIPINKVMGIVDDLSVGKHITHGYLGKRVEGCTVFVGVHTLTSALFSQASTCPP